MGTHKVKVIFSGAKFEKCYFTLDEEKSIKLKRRREGIFQGAWRGVDLRDACGRESIRFSLAAKRFAGKRYTLEILVDDKKFRTYKEKDGFHFEGNGWLSKADVVYLLEN